MEGLGAVELEELGALEVRPVYTGIHFRADRETLYRINYTSRLVSRVLAPIAVFKCHNTGYLYRRALRIEWEKILSPEYSFAVSANISNSKIRHSKYAALCLKDAIADYFRQTVGDRPDVDTSSPDLRLNLHIENNRATISMDTSGGSLHQRGYRKESVDAPMRETLAAAIIRLSGWNGEVPIYDPMCGSGTLLCEALLSISRIPSGFLRLRFGFEFLPDFDIHAWDTVRQVQQKLARKVRTGLITGSDRSGRAVSIARRNLGRLPGGSKIDVWVMPFENVRGIKDSVIVTNPPYGIRMGDRNELRSVYMNLGNFLKRRCTGSTAYIYFGSPDMVSWIGLRPSWRKSLKSGNLDGRLAKFVIY